MERARSSYKTVLRKSKYEYDKEKTNKFVKAKNKNAKQYWNMLKELAYVKPANIALSVSEKYFRAVNNPSDPFYTPDEDILYFNERYVNLLLYSKNWILIFRIPISWNRLSNLKQINLEGRIC